MHADTDLTDTIFRAVKYKPITDRLDRIISTLENRQVPRPRTTVSDRIKERMVLMDFTVQDLAAICDTSPAKIDYWISSDATPAEHDLYMLAQILDCSEQWLIAGNSISYSRLRSASETPALPCNDKSLCILVLNTSPANSKEPVRE